MASSACFFKLSSCFCCCFFNSSAFFKLFSAAYEVLVDELRDYRFYSEDLVHPSSAAVDFIWDKFEQAHCSGETISLSQEVKKIKASESHKALYLNSNADVKMKAQVLESKRELLKKHPYLNF